MSHEQQPDGGQQQQEPSREIERRDGPRIYVASLSDYNAGILHGVWLEADDEVEALEQEILAMLKASPTTKRYGDVAEEYAIHDYENFSRHVRLGEYESLDQVSRLARGIGRHGEAFAAWWANQEPEATEDDELDEQFEEHYLGEFGSLEEYGESVLEDMGIDLDELPGVPEGLRPYVTIDIEGWTRDMEMGGDITTVEGGRGVYVFWN